MICYFIVGFSTEVGALEQLIKVMKQSSTEASGLVLMLLKGNKTRSVISLLCSTCTVGNQFTLTITTSDIQK